MGHAEQEADGRRAGAPVTHYVHMNTGGRVFVKEASLFEAQGGLLGTWGVAWHGIHARDLEDARRIGQEMFARKKEHGKTIPIKTGGTDRNERLRRIEGVLMIPSAGRASASELSDMILTALDEPQVRLDDLCDHMALRRVPDYTALEYRVVAHLLNEGSEARRHGTHNPHKGNSIEHLLHAEGWLKEDLRLALIDASPSYARSQGFSVQDKESTLFKNGYEAGFKDAQLERKSAWQDWVLRLTIMQQSVLASAVRAPDGMRKFHPAKMLVRWYRRSVLVSAFDGKPLLDPHAPGGGSFTGPLTGDYTVQQMQDEFMLARDEMSLHYYAHMMHAAQIIGCYHPDDDVRDFWETLYKRMVNALHLNTESYSQMALRLSDDPAAWDERSDEAGSCSD